MKQAIHTKTQQEFNIVLEIFEKKGWEWRDGGIHTDSMKYWSCYKEDTCIVYNNHFLYCHICFYEKKWYKIISFQDFLEMEWLWEEKESSIKDKLHTAMIPRDDNQIITDSLDKICWGNELKKWDMCYISDDSDSTALIWKTTKIYDWMYNDFYVVKDDTDDDYYLTVWKYAVPIPKEEPKEEKPKFKVWDYAVVIWTSEYIKIVHIEDIDWHDIQYNSHLEADLRAPAQQELDTYFR